MSATANVMQISDSDFEKVTKGEGLVIVDCYADWCGPCRVVSPILEDLAKEYHGQVTVAKLNVDDNPQTPARFGVMGIPTLLAFKGGQHVDTVVGAAPKPALQRWLQRLLAA